jgi:hypothetical protein
MKKIAVAGLVLVAATLAMTPPSEARSRGPHHHRSAVHARVFVGVGPAFWWGPYPYWYYPPPYAVYAPPPVVVQETPPVYIQQQAPPPPPPQPPVTENFWYYCPSANGYYPSVPSCPESWVKVAPRSQ